MNKYIIIASFIVCSPLMGMLVETVGTLNGTFTHDGQLTHSYPLPSHNNDDDEEIEELTKDLAFLGILKKSGFRDTSKDGQQLTNEFEKTIHKYETAQLTKRRERDKKKSKL